MAKISAHGTGMFDVVVSITPGSTSTYRYMSDGTILKKYSGERWKRFGRFSPAPQWRVATEDARMRLLAAKAIGVEKQHAGEKRVSVIITEPSLRCVAREMRAE